jgi:hypothetical protein
MKPKYKVTGCARFFLFFIIFIPIVFFGAAYLRGENGVDELKKLYHRVTGRSETPSDTKTFNTEEEISELKKQLDEAQDKIRELESKVKEKEEEIKKLKEE